MARLLLFFVAIAAAVVVPKSNALDAFTLASREDVPNPDPVCMPQCQVDSCGSGSCSLPLEKRSHDSLSLEISAAHNLNNTLFKRVFNYRAGNQLQYKKKAPTDAEAATYLYAVQQNWENDYYGEVLEISDEESSAAISQQVEYGDQPFQIFTSGLVGCTVVLIVSDRAVWMAHFWQTYSHGLIELASGGHDTRNNLVFKQRVLDFIRGEKVDDPAPPLPPLEKPDFWLDPENWGYYQYVTPKGPKPNKNLYPEGQTQTYILTPVIPDTEALRENILYPNRMKEIIKAISDVLGYKPRTQGIPYTPRKADYPQHRDWMGKALFQCDPNSDKRGTKAYRIFLENNFLGPIPV